MEPTISSGSSMQINASAYDSTKPQRGDVIAYLEPSAGAVHAHRVVGLPGETVVYGPRKDLKIDGFSVPSQLPPKELAYVSNALEQLVLVEMLPGHTHLIKLDTREPSVRWFMLRSATPWRRCERVDEDLKCTVPSDSYFVLGDNRDNAMDSRYIGFVPSVAIKGKLESVQSK